MNVSYIIIQSLISPANTPIIYSEIKYITTINKKTHILKIIQNNILQPISFHILRRFSSHDYRSNLHRGTKELLRYLIVFLLICASWRSSIANTVVTIYRVSRFWLWKMINNTIIATIVSVDDVNH